MPVKTWEISCWRFRWVSIKYKIMVSLKNDLRVLNDATCFQNRHDFFFFSGEKMGRWDEQLHHNEKTVEGKELIIIQADCLIRVPNLTEPSTLGKKYNALKCTVQPTGKFISIKTSSVNVLYWLRQTLLQKPSVLIYSREQEMLTLIKQTISENCFRQKVLKGISG